MSIKSLIMTLLPDSFLKWQKDVCNQICAGRAYRNLVMRRNVQKLRKKPLIKVLFIAYTPSMWKVDSLYQAMKRNPRFEPQILLVPNMTMSDTAIRAKGLLNLRSFFQQKNYDYVEWCDIKGNSEYERIPKEYDIIFYPQPYPGLIPQNLDFPHNQGRLMIGCDYAFHSGNQNWAYNKWYQNAAWLDLYENQSTYELSCKIKDNKGVNSVVTGLPIMDEFTQSEYRSPWKPRPTQCKRIIWAPHWTLSGQDNRMPSYSNFLEMADFMLNFARSNSKIFQFAFKPHPHLKRELYKHPDWGKDKTEAYYSAWIDGENTQLEEGEYIDLFMTSDAMIHDSSSFCCEYLMTGKPVLFMVKNEELQVNLLNEMARTAFYAQYLGYTMSDLDSFLKDIVLQSNDFKKETRDEVATRFMIPPYGTTAAENIISVILDKNRHT